eukprot:1160675-Pelagomonas_calceolata.AAC.10
MERDAKLMRFHGMDTFDRDEIITVWIVCILRGLCKNAIDISTPVHRLLRAACTVRCAHSQPLDLIGTTQALKCSWRYKLPELMLRFVSVAQCA